MTYFLYFAVYAALFDVLYGVVAAALLVLPLMLMAFAGVAGEVMDKALPILAMVVILPWKGGTLWSAAQATRRRVRDRNTFLGAIGDTLGDVRLYLGVVPLIGRVFRIRAAASAEK